jgi:hypothetical protein
MKYQKIVLPFDWTPDETVPTTRLTEIAALHHETGDNATQVTIANAEAVLVEPVCNSTAATAPTTAE